MKGDDKSVCSSKLILDPVKVWTKWICDSEGSVRRLLKSKSWQNTGEVLEVGGLPADGVMSLSFIVLVSLRKSIHDNYSRLSHMYKRRMPTS